MARRRKTKAEREQERYVADRRAWEVFRPRLESVASFTDALQLMSESVPPDAPGRRYYSNLAFFMQGFSPPAGANALELRQYRRPLEVFESEGALRLGARSQLESALNRAIEQRPPL
jgi:hypothetical protein